MAIKFGMTVADMILQLTRGFIKATGRKPDGLEKIKIKQEANQRFRDQQKVVDMEGRTLDPSKPITGGTQEGAKSITLQDRKIKKAYDKAVSEGKFKGSEDQFRDKIDMMVDDIDSDFAIGGRVGFKKGMDRRTFMKMVGGITALPFLGKFFKGAEVAAPVVEKAVDVASGAPPYFFNLVDRIRALGQKVGGPKERTESFLYKDYSMDIDLDTGKIDIKKTKEAMIPGGDEAGIAEEVYMTYKPGVADETTKGRKVVDEYEEFTARPDIDGKMKDVEDGVPDEVVREGSIGKEELEQEIIEQVAREKKASGGIAMMLGQ